MSVLLRPLRLAVLVTCGLGLASCGSEADNKGSFRMIQASPDLAPVNFLVNGVALVSAIDYKSGPGFLSVTPKTYTFAVESILPDEDGQVVTEPVIAPVAQAIAAGREYTLITLGKASAATGAPEALRPLVIENEVEVVPVGNARLQFVHAATDVPAVVDIYLTTVPVAPAVLPDLSTQTPIAQVTYGAQPAARQLVQTGTYVIRVALPGSTVPVFQSINVGLSNGSDLLIVAVDNNLAGPAPISLAISSGFRGFFTDEGTEQLLDKDTLSNLRVVQLSPDAPAMNILGTRPQEPAIPPSTVLPPLREVTFATGLNYLDATGYVAVIPDTYSLRGVRTADPTATTPLFTVFPTPTALALGQRSTLFVIGRALTTPSTFAPLVRPDEIRSVFQEGKLRIVDASPSSGVVDVYILKAGTPITEDVPPTLQNLSPGVATTHLVFFPQDYRVTFTMAGSKTELAAVNVAATSGTVHTAILVDAIRPDATSPGTPPAVLLLNDLAS